MDKYEGACAVISDVHLNDTSLEKVLKNISSKGIIRIVCLGDILGYGHEISTIIQKFSTGWKARDGNVYPYETIEGNHERHLLELYNRDITPETLINRCGLNPEAVSTLLEVSKLLEQKTPASQKKLEFLRRLPKRVQIVKGVYGIHAFDNIATGFPMYTMPIKLGESYGIGLDLLHDPRDAFKDPSMFSKGIKVYIIGHNHLQLGCGIKHDGTYEVLLPPGTKQILDRPKKKPKLDKELEDFFAADEAEEDESEENETYMELAANNTEMDLKNYGKAIINPGSLSRSRIEDFEIFNAIHSADPRRRKLLQEIRARGNWLSSAFYGILRKDMVFEFKSLLYERRL